MDRARLGALSSLDAGTSGTYYFDAFESRRVNYMGPMALAPPMHFASYHFSPLQQGGSYSSQLDGASGVDTYILSSSPDTNNGTAVVMWVGEGNNATNRVARSKTGPFNS